MSALYYERDWKTLISNRTRQRLQLIAHEIFIPNAIYGDQLAFLEVLAQDAEMVVVYVALLRQRLHKSDTILDRLSAER